MKRIDVFSNDRSRQGVQSSHVMQLESDPTEVASMPPNSPNATYTP